LGDHNSAPQANQTLRLELSGSLQAGEHIWRGKCVSSAPFFPWKSGMSTLHANTDQAQAARAEAWGSMRRVEYNSRRTRDAGLYRWQCQNGCRYSVRM